MGTNSRSNGRTTESRLPPRGNDVVAFKFVSEVLSELGNAEHRAGCLDIEAYQDDGPGGIEAPGAGPGVFPERCPDPRFVLLLVGGVAKLAVLLRYVQPVSPIFRVRLGHPLDLDLFGVHCIQWGGRIVKRGYSFAILAPAVQDG